MLLNLWHYSFIHSRIFIAPPSRELLGGACIFFYQMLIDEWYQVRLSDLLSLIGIHSFDIKSKSQPEIWRSSQCGVKFSWIAVFIVIGFVGGRLVVLRSDGDRCKVWQSKLVNMWMDDCGMSCHMYPLSCQPVVLLIWVAAQVGKLPK